MMHPILRTGGVAVLVILSHHLTMVNAFVTTPGRIGSVTMQPIQNRNAKLRAWGSKEKSTLGFSEVFQTVTSSVPLAPLRIGAGLLMIHHGSEGGIGPANFGTDEFNGFVDFIVKPYFSFLPGPPETWSAIHDLVEFFGGALLVFGFLTRPVALSLLGTMMGAVYFHLSSSGLQGFPLGHVKNYSYDFEEPTLYALIFLLFVFNGAGPLSVDSIIYDKISQEDDDE